MKNTFCFYFFKKKTAFFLENTKHTNKHSKWSLNVLSCHKIVSCTYFCCYSAIYLVGVYFIFMSGMIAFSFKLLVFEVIEFIWILSKLLFFCNLWLFWKLSNWVFFWFLNAHSLYFYGCVENWATVRELNILFWKLSNY